MVSRSTQRSRYHIKTLFAFLAICTTVLLSGCDKKGPCPVTTIRNPPDIPFEPDLKALDRLAGCNNNWNFFFGKPCASDVPILLAKKGINDATDREWLLSSLENEESFCLSRYSGEDEKHCSSWFTAMRSCWRDELAICNCSRKVMNSSVGCESWRCYIHEIDHNTCWEADWDDSFDTKCDLKGNYPMQLDLLDYLNLLKREISTAQIGTRGFDDMFARHVKRKYTMFDGPNGKECLVQKPVGEAADRKPPCEQWRHVTSKISHCICSDSTCMYWKCNSQRMEEMTVEHNQQGRYKCLAHLHGTCVKWAGDIAGFPLVAQVQCQTCRTERNKLPWEYLCRFPNLETVCTRYVMEHVVEFATADTDDGIWHERFGFFFLHLLWLGPLVSVAAAAVICGLENGIKVKFLFQRAAILLLTVFCVVSTGLIIWAIAFTRNMRNTDARHATLPRYQMHVTPAGPLLGVLLTLLISGLGTCLYGIAHSDEVYSKGFAIESFLIFILIFVYICLLYVCGALVSSPLLAPLGYLYYRVPVLLWRRHLSLWLQNLRGDPAAIATRGLLSRLAEDVESPADPLGKVLGKAEAKMKQVSIDGRWTDGKALRTISGSYLTWEDGTQSQLRPVSATEWSVYNHGELLTVKLKDGSLHWSDGDIWSCLEARYFVKYESDFGDAIEFRLNGQTVDYYVNGQIKRAAIDEHDIDGLLLDVPAPMSSSYAAWYKCKDEKKEQVMALFQLSEEDMPKVETAQVKGRGKTDVRFVDSSENLKKGAADERWKETQASAEPPQTPDTEFSTPAHEIGESESDRSPEQSRFDFSESAPKRKSVKGDLRRKPTFKAKAKAAKRKAKAKSSPTRAGEPSANFKDSEDEQNESESDQPSAEEEGDTSQYEDAAQRQSAALIQRVWRKSRVQREAELHDDSSPSEKPEERDAVF